MKTHTTRKAFWTRSLLLLPLLAALIYSCSTEEERPMPVVKEVLENNSQEIASPEMIRQYNSIARKYNSKEDLLVGVADYRKMRQIYDLMSPEQKKAAEKLPEAEVIEVVEDEEDTSATPAMIAEYNKLAKIYLAQGVTSANIEDEEFQRLFYIYGIMTPAQRETAEKLPPPPPPMPLSEVNDKDLIAPPPPPSIAVNPPPPPPSPGEAVKKWIEEGAEFFYNGKVVSGKEALKVVQKNNGKNISVNVEKNNSGKTVHLSDNEK